MEKAKYTSDDMIKVLSKFMDKQTIIIGHGLENDLKSMRLIHTRIIDTSIVYNSEVSYPRKPGLSKLCKKYMNKDFRAVDSSHDSVSDAIATLELAHFALENNIHTVIKPKIPDLWTLIREKTSYTIEVVSSDSVSNYGNIDPENVKCSIEADSRRRHKLFVEKVKDMKSDILFGHFNDMKQIPEEEEANIAAMYNEIVRDTFDNIQPETCLLIYAGSGNLWRLKNPASDEFKTVVLDELRKGLCWVINKQFI